MPWDFVPVPRIEHPPSTRSSMAVFPKNPLRQGNITWRDAGADTNHDYPRRNLIRHGRVPDGKLWWDGETFSKNRARAANGLFSHEVQAAMATPVVSRRARARSSR